VVGGIEGRAEVGRRRGCLFLGGGRGEWTLGTARGDVPAFWAGGSALASSLMVDLVS